MEKIIFLLITISLAISTVTHAQNYDCEFSSGSFGSWDGKSATTVENVWSEGTVSLIQEPNDSSKFVMVSGIGNIPMSRKDTGFGYTFLSEKMGDQCTYRYLILLFRSRTATLQYCQDTP